MTWVQILASLLFGVGALFFAAGSLGLLRLPDVFSRLHALTKADNLGLGCIVVGASLLAESWMAIVQLLLVWLLLVLASATTGHLIAQNVRRQGEHDDARRRGVAPPERS